MAADESDRLVVRLMSSLPPVHWTEVATKSDLRALGDRLDLRLTSELAKFEAKIVHQLAVNLRVMVLAMVATVITTVGVVVSAAGLSEPRNTTQQFSHMIQSRDCTRHSSCAHRRRRGRVC